MEIMIEPDYGDFSFIEESRKALEQCLNEILLENQIDTLDKIIVTKDNQENYIQSIQKNTKKMTRLYFSSDEKNFQKEAIVMGGEDNQGRFLQLLFIRESFYLAFLASFIEENYKTKNFYEKNIYGRELFFHLIGYVMNNQILVEQYGYFYSKREEANLQEKLKYKTIMLWSEYFAQRISDLFLPADWAEEDCRKRKENLEKHILSLRRTEKENYDYSCQIIVLFLKYISYFHGMEKEIPIKENWSNNTAIKKYLGVFEKLENMVKILFQNRKNWNFEKDRDILCEIIEEVMQIGRQKQTVKNENKIG